MDGSAYYLAPQQHTLKKRKMKVTRHQLRKIIKESIGSNVTFEWAQGGLSMVMYVDGQEVMQFGTQKEVRDLISQLEELLAGPMRTSS